MGMRYVWDKYSTKIETTENSESLNVYAGGIVYQTYFHIISSWKIRQGSYYVTNQSVTLCDISDGVNTEFNIPQGYAFRMGYQNDSVFNYIMVAPYAMTITVQGTGNRPRITSSSYFLFNELIDTRIKDSFLGVATNASNSAYPSDGL